MKYMNGLHDVCDVGCEKYTVNYLLTCNKNIYSNIAFKLGLQCINVYNYEEYYYTK